MALVGLSAGLPLQLPLHYGGHSQQQRVPHSFGQGALLLPPASISGSTVTRKRSPSVVRCTQAQTATVLPGIAPLIREPEFVEKLQKNFGGEVQQERHTEAGGQEYAELTAPAKKAVSLTAVLGSLAAGKRGTDVVDAASKEGPGQFEWLAETLSSFFGAGAATEDAKFREELLHQIITYGELAQTTYDTMSTKNVHSLRFGDVIGEIKSEEEFLTWPSHTFTQNQDKRYQVVKYLYASGGAYRLVNSGGKTTNYVGHIAELKPTGDGKGREIVVTWRGTITKGEWLQDAKTSMTDWNAGFPLADFPDTVVSSDLSRTLGLDWGLYAGVLSGYVTDLVHFTDPYKVGVLVGILVALLRAIYIAAETAAKNPEKMNDGLLVFLLKALGVVGGWVLFAASTTFKTQFLAPDCPNVSFGFKEMYTEVDDKDGSKGLEPPRLTVLKTVLSLLEKAGDEPVSIVTTGHSLGGALASLSAFDLGEIIRGIEEEDPNQDEGSKGQGHAFVKEAAEYKEGLDLSERILGVAGIKQHLQDYHRATDAAVTNLEKHLRERKAKGILPQVTAVTFSAPRVGDILFSERFGPINVPPVPPVKKGAFSLQYLFFIVQRAIAQVVLQLGPFGDISMWVIILAVGYFITHLPGIPILSDIAWPTLELFIGLTAIFRLGGWTYGKLSGKGSVGTREAVPPVLRALRIRNLHDVVPSVPSGLGSLQWYRHGGYELLGNAYAIEAFKGTSSLAVQLFNVFSYNLLLPWGTVGALHNLEVMLKMVSPDRDFALMNKSDDVVKDDYRIPPCWFQPQPNLGIARRSPDGKWREADANSPGSPSKQ